MKRGIKLISIGGIMLAAITVAVVAMYINVFAKHGIERGSEHALGVDTSVDDVNLGLVSGKFGISDFHVRNPEGFETEDFFVLQNARLSVGMRSVMADTVIMDELSLDGIELNLEFINGNGNYKAILDHLKQFEKKNGTQKSKEPTKRFIIDRLTVTNVVARVRVKSPKLGIDKEMTVEVPEIRMEKVGAKKGGVGLPEITSIVVTRMLDAVMREGGDLPSQIRSAINKELGQLVKQQRSLVGDVETSGRQAVEEAADDAVDEAKDKLKGLLGGGGN
jgi:hypothetical protein